MKSATHPTGTKTAIRIIEPSVLLFPGASVRRGNVGGGVGELVGVAVGPAVVGEVVGEVVGDVVGEGVT